MTFDSAASIEMPEVGAGVATLVDRSYIYTASDGGIPFEDGIKIGRFAQIKSGVLSNMDATPTPVVAGVVLRSPARPVTEDMVYSKEFCDNDVATAAHGNRWHHCLVVPPFHPPLFSHDDGRHGPAHNGS